MAGPKEKFFGNLTIDALKEAIKLPGRTNEYNGQKQLKITAAQWDDNGISIGVWDAEQKKEIRIGSLRVSKLEDNKSQAPAPAAGNDDMPF